MSTHRFAAAGVLLCVALTPACGEAPASIDADDDGVPDGKTDGFGPAATVSIAEIIADTVFELPVAALDGSRLRAPSHGSYVSIALPAEGYAQLRAEVSAQSGVALAGRGEAHVTVITPPEFAVLKKKVPLRDLKTLAAAVELQGADLLAECLGVGEKTLAEQTVYVVVASAQIVDYRAQVQALFEQRGGTPGAFRADRYFPHVTVGFTRRDLHESDGIIKDVASCPDPANLRVGP